MSTVALLHLSDLCLFVGLGALVLAVCLDLRR